MKKVTMYKADDGKIFENIEECRTYEKELKSATLWEAMKTLKDCCSQVINCGNCPFCIEGTNDCFFENKIPNYWEKIDINIEKL